jgi:hypothetical protein
MYIRHYFTNLAQTTIQTQTMHDEKWQDGDRARGVEDTVCDPPITPPPLNPPSTGNNVIVIQPHR